MKRRKALQRTIAMASTLFMLGGTVLQESGISFAADRVYAADGEEEAAISENAAEDPGQEAAISGNAAEDPGQEAAVSGNTAEDPGQEAAVS